MPLLPNCHHDVAAVGFDVQWLMQLLTASRAGLVLPA